MKNEMKTEEALLKDLTSISEAFPEDTWLTSMTKATREGERTLLKSISKSEEVVEKLGRSGTLGPEEIKALDMLSSFTEGIYRKTLTQYAAFRHSLRMLEDGVDPEGLAQWMENSGKDKNTLLIETKAALEVMNHIIVHWIDGFDELRSRE